MLTTPTPTFNWSPVTNAARYGLYISTAEGATVYTNTTVNGTAFVLPTPLDGGRYRWRVTAFNAVGESPSSNTLYFQVPLAAPVNIAPGTTASPGPQLTTGAPTFQWSAVAGAAGYRLYVTTPLGQAIYTNDHVAGTSFTLPLPFTTGDYRWQVSAFGAIGESALSPFFYFRIPPAPLRPLSPGSNSAPGPLKSETLTFRWTAVEGASRYGLYITNAARVPVYRNVNVTAMSLVLTASLPSDQYQWQVTVFTADGESAMSNAFYFQVPPLAPYSFSPGNTQPPGNVLDDSALTFKWKEVPGASRYGVYVTVAPHGEANVVFQRTNLTTTSYPPPVSLGTGEYRWYATAFNAIGESRPSNTRYFRIQNAGAPVIATTLAFCEPVDRVPVVRLAWNDTAGAEAYVVLRDGVPLATTASVTFDDQSGIVAGRSYQYQVQALTATGVLTSAAVRIAVPIGICDVPSAADLAPSDLTLSRRAANPGTVFGVRLNMRNRGGTAAAASFTRLILTNGSVPRIADPILATIRTPSIPAGQSVGLSVALKLPSTIPLGTYFVVVQADVTHIVNQFDLSNDTVRSALVVGPMPPCSLGCSTRVPSRAFAYLPVRMDAALDADASCPEPAVTWNFRDGTTGEGGSASHMYTKPGHYSWTMTAQGAESCRRSGMIEVTAPRMTRVAGLVVDDQGNAIGGATIAIEAAPSTAFTTTSAADGSYVTELLTAGTYSATISAPSFVTSTEEIVIPGGMTSYDRNFRLLAPAPEVTVTSLTARTPLGSYPDGTFFLDTASHRVELIADIDWGAHVPGLVTLTTPRIPRDEVKASGARVRRSFDMGLGIGPCGTISAIARAADGVESSSLAADYHVMSVPWFAFGQLSGVRTEYGPGSFAYGSTLELSPMPENETEVKDNLPLVGNKKLKVDLKPSVEWEITSDGESSITTALEASTAPFAKFDQVELGVKVSGGARGTYDPERCQWMWSGRFGLSGSVSVTSPSWTFVIPLGPITIPGYANASMSLAAAGEFGFDAESVNVEEASLELTGRGTLAAGIEDVAALEGWLELAGRYAYRPSRAQRHELSGTIRAGGAAYFWRWRHEFVLFDRTWSTEFGNVAVVPLTARAMTLDSRRWISSSPRTEHRRGLRTVTVLATNELPQSMPDLAVTGSEPTVAWLSDLPSRSAINGVAVVASTQTNGRWSERVVVDDDGTADFRPRITATPEGALLVWENMRSVLSDSATLEDTAAGSEISVAESAGFGSWSRSTRLTDNGYLDRSPQIRGDSLNSAMVIWIANRANDLYGSTTRPNELWSSTKSASGWGAARPIASLPYPVIRTALWFSGGSAIVVLSADMDGDPHTMADRELLALTSEDGVWSSVRRLTNDTSADDAPSLAAAASGPRLFWLREGKLVTCPNLDVGSSAVIHSPINSSSLSSYRVAAAPDGTMAVVWAEASEFDSDLRAIRYDAAADQWGKPQQLTHDKEIEKFVSAALDGENRLLVAYDRAILARPPVSDGGAGNAVSAPSDEITLLASDSAVDLAAEKLEVALRNVLPDDIASGSVTVANRGSVSVPSFTVDIQGDASDDIVATVAMAQPLAPGETSTVEWSFAVPATVSRQLFAVVHTGAGDDGDPSNDIASAHFGSPDLAIALARVELLGDRTTVVARVTNAGNLVSQPASLVARNSDGGLLGTAQLGPIQAGQSFDAVIRLHVSSPAPLVPVHLVIDERGETIDARRSNNTRTVYVKTTPRRRRSVR